METTYDNSNSDASLNNVNQEIFQKSNANAFEIDIDMDIKNTNITSQSPDNLNNIPSYTNDKQQPTNIMDQTPIPHGEFIFGGNKQPAASIIPFETNGTNNQFNRPDNDFGPESNVDEIDNEVDGHFDINRPDDLVEPHSLQFEDMKCLKTVDEVEENDMKKDMDISEQRVNSLDADDVGVDTETMSDVTAEISPDNATRQIGDDVQLESAVVGDFENNPFVTPEKVNIPVLEAAYAENVVVPESGEDSEDEWKYIKVEQEGEKETKDEKACSELCPDLVNDNQSHDDEIVRIENSSLNDSDMSSQLNPDAKEFVPTTPSPTNSATPSNHFEKNGPDTVMTVLNPSLNLETDLILTQSPRKGAEVPMKNITVPDELDFLVEISKRPCELNASATSDDADVPVDSAKTELRPGSSSSQCSYQEMNLKEAMHGDEKQEYAPDVETTPDQAGYEANANGDHEQFMDILNVMSMCEQQDPMNESFYNNGTNNPFAVDLNAVHELPTSDDENEMERQIEQEQMNMLRHVMEMNIINGTRPSYEIEDTEFEANPPAAQSDQSSNVEELSSQSNDLGANDIVNVQGEADNIVRTVQEMISENMAVLDECNLTQNNSLPTGEAIESNIDLSSVPVKSEPAVESVPAPVPEPIVEAVEQIEEKIVEVKSESVTVTAAAPVPEVTARKVVTDIAAAKSKPTQKNPDPKSRSAPVAAATKKPLSTTAKPKLKPDTAPTTTTTAKTAPIPRPRSVPSTTATKPIDKKPATTTTATAKRTTNGDAKPASATTAAPKRPVSTTTVKSTVSARSTAPTVKVSSTRTTVTTRTTTTTSASVPTKRVPITARSSATATTTTATTTQKARSDAVAAAKPSTARPKPPAPKVAASTNDKVAKEPVTKLNVSGSRAPIVSPRVASATTARTSTLVAKKVDATKAPSPAKRLATTSTTATLSKRSPVPAVTKANPTQSPQKRPISTLTKTRPTKAQSPKVDGAKAQPTLAKETNGHANGEIGHENGHQNGENGAVNVLAEQLNGMSIEATPLIDANNSNDLNEQQPIIDLMTN